jgi:GNAT superfamily N-acetyltransferase
MRPRLLPAAMNEIVPASPDQYQAALGLLFERLPAAEQHQSIADVLKALRGGRVIQHGLLTAHEGEAIVGSDLFILQADRTAFVWPPAVVPGKDETAIEDALLAEVIRRINSAGAWIGQCLIELNRRHERETLERNGFRHLTDLRFLARRLDDFLRRAATQEIDAADELEVIPYEPGVNDARFARVIEATYLETSDCPELEGTRTGEQALVSHRMSGEFDPSRWKLYRWQGRDAGVLLFNDHPEQSVWEVVYLGVVRDSRGHSLGRRMLTRGLIAARAAQRSAVVLAVDCRNKYADKLYSDLGFEQTDRRAVHLYFPPRTAGGAAHR